MASRRGSSQQEHSKARLCTSIARFVEYHHLHTMLQTPELSTPLRENGTESGEKTKSSGPLDPPSGHNQQQQPHSDFTRAQIASRRTVVVSVLKNLEDEDKQQFVKHPVA